VLSRLTDWLAVGDHIPNGRARVGWSAHSLAGRPALCGPPAPMPQRLAGG